MKFDKEIVDIQKLICNATTTLIKNMYSSMHEFTILEQFDIKH